MPSATSNSSRHYIPGSCEELERQKWQRAQASRDRNAAFDTLNRYCHSKGGFVVSLPGDPLIVLEVLPDFDLARRCGQARL